MRNILGLDLGTNSIGWALIQAEEEEEEENGKIRKSGSRVIPMDEGEQSKYDNGTLQSQASLRTGFRGVRRLYERSALRRERLLRVLNIMGFLPEHYKQQIDFDKHPGQFINGAEPLLPYRKNNGKSEFIFTDSFKEMLDEFKTAHPDIISNGKKIPHDWTIYYLRKKALTRPVSKEELAWIILNFNAKRGYYQRTEDEEDESQESNKTVEYAVLKIANIEDEGVDAKKRNLRKYKITYETGESHEKSFAAMPYEIGDELEAIITKTKKKDGSIKVDLRLPEESDWTLIKKRTESEISKSGKTVGAYIYDNILKNPDVKVRGKLVHTIERKYYKDELKTILKKQKEFISELRDSDLLSKCINELYRNNEEHRKALEKKDFVNFIVNDIVFYQRPLKSKKSEIAECPFEYRTYRKDGEECTKHLKCIPKSNPLYQEFRLWQFVQNLIIIERTKEVNGHLCTDVDVTSEFINGNDGKACIFSKLNDHGSINQKELLKMLGIKGNDADKYRWNYVEDKTYPCNETRHDIFAKLKNVSGLAKPASEDALRQWESLANGIWQIVYSVTDPDEYAKALKKFAEKHNLDVDTFVKAFKGMKTIDKDYGAYSEKAIKKMLPLMRCGKYWSADAIDSQTQTRINHIIDGEVDDTISMRVREKAIDLKDISDFQGLPVWLASYIIYNRHSEASDTSRWERPEDIDYYLQNEFKKEYLRNPVVERVLGESLRVTRDIWKTYGEISEVHIEMARNLKQPKEKRINDTNINAENQRTNMRIRALLQEFAYDKDIHGVRPESPMQQEKFKIYEEYVRKVYLGMEKEEDKKKFDELCKIISELGNPTTHVSKSDIQKYKLWIDQKYVSPYTGRPIPLSRLFTTDYQIEHIIPRKRYYDDSMENKVICEAVVNREKGNKLAYEFITDERQEIKDSGKTYTILSKKEYEELVKNNYNNQPRKRDRLLMSEIPEKFANRQLNDSRYIARKSLEIFSHLVRDENETEATSKHVIATNGSITTRLKHDWGINDVWNDIVTPRFERLNSLTSSNLYGHFVEDGGKRYFQTEVPLEESKNFNKKRIDHRHHAMDAIVIACTTRDMVNYLNNESSLVNDEEKRDGLKIKLCYKHKTDDAGNYQWLFKKPWETFTQDVRSQLCSMVVSFKQNLRLLTKSSNLYWHYVNGKKVLSRQTKGDGWAIRKPLHKKTVSGAVRLQSKKNMPLKKAIEYGVSAIADKDVRKAIREAQKLYHGKADANTIVKYFKDRDYMVNGKNIKTVEVYYMPDADSVNTYATRKPITKDFTLKMIDAVTDSGIQKILKHHLAYYVDEKGNEAPDRAFSPEGLAEMNRNIKQLNDGKDHKPIYSVRLYEKSPGKYAIGTRGNKKSKFVETAKGANLFFAVYVDEEGNRSFDPIPLNIAAERLKQKMPVAPEVDGKGHRLIFTLSPFDIVYLPDPEETFHKEDIEGKEISRTDFSKLYRFVSYSGNQAFFLPVSVASPIKEKEFGSHNKFEIDSHGRSIKEYCIKLNVNRLGIITGVQQ